MQTNSVSEVYTGTVVRVEECGDAIIELPKEMIEKLGWQLGDEIDYTKNSDGFFEIKNLTKEKNAS